MRESRDGIADVSSDGSPLPILNARQEGHSPSGLSILTAFGRIVDAAHDEARNVVDGPDVTRSATRNPARDDFYGVGDVGGAGVGGAFSLAFSALSVWFSLISF